MLQKALKTLVFLNFVAYFSEVQAAAKVRNLPNCPAPKPKNPFCDPVKPRCKSKCYQKCCAKKKPSHCSAKPKPEPEPTTTTTLPPPITEAITEQFTYYQPDPEPELPGENYDDYYEYPEPENIIDEPEISGPANIEQPAEVIKQVLDGPLGCELNGQNYNHNDLFKTDSCTICLCLDGGIKCDVIECPIPKCAAGFVVGKRNSWDCCDSCILEI